MKPVLTSVCYLLVLPTWSGCGPAPAALRSLPPIHNPPTEPKIDEATIWTLRDSFDRLAFELPHEEWAAQEAARSATSGEASP